MLFSSPDYPVFLIAVFFLYGLARWGRGAEGALARIGVMVLLGDIVFMLVAKDPDTLWDPIGGPLLRLAAGDQHGWSPWLAARWIVGGALLRGAILAGERGAAWIASDRGQRLIARGLVLGLAAIATTVAIAAAAGSLDEVTAQLVAHGHLAVLVVLGVGIGASRTERHQTLGRVIVLFFASTLFYHAWAAAMPGVYRYLLGVLLATIILDYYLGIWIEGTEDPRKRKALVVISLCSNLGILVFFKYTDFFAQDIVRPAWDLVTGEEHEVRRLGLILPAGISFHTFQSLSYTIDVYRRELPATRSVVQFATFVLFFPQLVAGPIVRAQELLPQLAASPALDLARAQVGMFRIVIGLFKKIAIADTLAIAIVDNVFKNPERYSSVEVLAGVYGYALQIYLDFSAYSDIAIGSAILLGFTLPENFRTPYRSANLQEFWRRWHISLSTWLRDYLYVTLGGNRLGPARTYVNLIATMLLGGLWHGASWAFIVWGGLHGFGLAITRYFQRAAEDVARRLFVVCSGLCVVGVLLLRYVLSDAGPWTTLLLAWVFVAPLWAVVTAWLGFAREGVGRAPAEAEASAEAETKAQPAATAKAAKAAGKRRGQAKRKAGAAGKAAAAVGKAAAAKAAGKPEATPSRAESRALVGALRIAMVAAGIAFFAALEYAASWTWIPLILVTWGLALAADVLDRGTAELGRRAVAMLRRAAAALLVFHYVCLAWIFFRAPTFPEALAVLEQLGKWETDHPNLVPLVTTALTAGFACHCFAEGSFRWLRDRFVALPAIGQGLVLAAAALALRELGQPKIVPFIYFQF
ncbi:MAG TPA: MBOAT family O-acyltransferase [Kofleriaceae bacterium]|nr:MBOAT family O-acyltransferase [Kofleriaceae bacterium]